MLPNTPQLDDLMDPVQPPVGKAPNKMARFFNAALASSAAQLIAPDNLLMTPEYWILRFNAGNNVGSPTVLITRAGGDDLTLVIPGPDPAGLGANGTRPDYRVILPGPSPWIRITNNGPGSLGVFGCAMAGYNPNEIF